MNEDRPIIRSPLKAVRLKCLDCCCGSWKEVEDCACETTCFLWPYRLGKNPYIKRTLTDEQKQKLTEQLQKGRKSQ